MPLEVGTNSSDRGLQRLALLGAAPRLVPSLSKHWRGDPDPLPMEELRPYRSSARGPPSSAIRCHRPRYASALCRRPAEVSSCGEGSKEAFSGGHLTFGSPGQGSLGPVSRSNVPDMH